MLSSLGVQMIDKSQCMLHCGTAPPALIRASATCRSSAVQHATWQRATRNATRRQLLEAFNLQPVAACGAF